MRNRVGLVISLALLSLVFFAPTQVHAACADVQFTVGASNAVVQFFAPLLVELDFQPTWTSRNQNWGAAQVSNTTAKMIVGGNNIQFQAVGNDTYWWWIEIIYPYVINQTVTLLYKEGDRPTSPQSFCMNGQRIYIQWTNIIVMPEPHPADATQVAQALYPQLSTGYQAQADSNNALSGSVTALTVVVGIEAIAIGVLAYIVLVFKRFRR